MMDIAQASKDISKLLHAEMKAGRITRADIETIRAAVAGYCACESMGFHTPQHLMDDLVNMTLRKFVEACA